MADIAPFHGYRFSEGKVGAPGEVISPPYDVIDAEKRDALLARNAYNVARIIRSPEAETEPAGGRYTAAAALFHSWMDEGALGREERPALYVYRQDYAVEGKRFTRLGLVARVKLAELGEGVRPHERTLAGPKADRLELLTRTRAHFGQVFGLIPDEGGALDALLREAACGAPALDATDDDGVRHALYVVADEKRIAALQAAAAPGEVFIADGHHRYETALNYKHAHPKLEDANWTLMTLVSFASEGLAILPTHRLVKAVASFDAAKLLEEAGAEFEVRRFDFDATSASSRDRALEELKTALAAAFAGGGHALGLYAPGTLALLTLKNLTSMNDSGAESAAWKSLDVAILHKLLLEKRLGIDDAALERQTNVEYLKDTGEAVAKGLAAVDAGTHQMLALVSPTRLSEVEAVARAGEKMPQKSTFFHPKVYTGLVIYRLER